MDFTFSPDQDQLRVAVRAFLDKEAPKDYVRRMAEHDDAGITPEVWRTIVELGWTGVLVPEECGGLGLGVVDAVSCRRRWAARVFPGPVLLVRDPRDARGQGPRARRSTVGAGRRPRAGHGGGRRGRIRRLRSTACTCAPTVAATATASTA